MADVSVHFSIGLAAGAMASLVPLWQRLGPRRQLAGLFIRYAALAYGMGCLAVLPNLLRRAGVPESVCTGVWTYLCFGHPLVDRLETGGKLAGQLVILTCFGVQYALLALAIRARRRAAMALSDV